MPRPRPAVLALAAAVLASSAALAGGSAAAADTTGHPFTFAVVGDVPYGPDAVAHFPTFIQGINDDPDVTQVVHLGDIKSGSELCSDERLQQVRDDFDLFADPLYYTPGDNEWTDCHRLNNGAYNPFERLAKVRDLFFSPAGQTLGAPVPVASQAARGFPENARWVAGDVSFATLHVIGSNDDLAPWTGLGNTAPTQQQVAEERARMRAAIDNVHQAVTTGLRRHLSAVVLQQQADMFDVTVPDPQYADYSAFRPLVRALIRESARFGGPVYLFNGDSHRLRIDRPLEAGSSWLSFYGVDGSAPNLKRITVDGSDLGEADWLKVVVHPGTPDPLAVQQVPGR